MNKNVFEFRKGRSIAIAVGMVVTAGLVIANDPAAAQKEDAQVPEVVEVIAPRAVREEVGTTAIGARVEVVKVTRQVIFADLDLKRQSARKELDRRIDEKAKEACKQLDTILPLSPPDPDCVKKAVESAAAQKESVLAAFK
jgi:UrcA family protein